MESGAITDRQIHSQSNWKSPYFNDAGRLNGELCWIPYYPKSWFRVDFLEKKKISAIATQGAPHEAYWMTRYRLEYSDDRQHWLGYQTAAGELVSFTDQNEISSYSGNPI